MFIFLSFSSWNCYNFSSSTSRISCWLLTSSPKQCLRSLCNLIFFIFSRSSLFLVSHQFGTCWVYESSLGSFFLFTTHLDKSHSSGWLIIPIIFLISSSVNSPALLFGSILPLKAGNFLLTSKLMLSIWRMN